MKKEKIQMTTAGGGGFPRLARVTTAGGGGFPRLARVMTCLMLMLTGLGTGA